MQGECCGGFCESPHRSFLTKAEKLEMLKEYRQALENEVKGIAERIKELEKGN